MDRTSVTRDESSASWQEQNYSFGSPILGANPLMLTWMTSDKSASPQPVAVPDSGAVFVARVYSSTRESRLSPQESDDKRRAARLGRAASRYWQPLCGGRTAVLQAGVEPDHH